MVLEGTRAFLAVVRQGHPHTPVVVASPVVRPDAEGTPNRLGASLADLRRAMEEAVNERIAGGDDALVLVPGADILGPDHLADGIHPHDEGHARLAAVVGPALGALGARSAARAGDG
jgi:lysophospholipase L1-like esterase